MNRVILSYTAFVIGITATIVTCITGLSLSFVHAQTTLDSTICNQLYGLPAGTIATAVSQQYFNPTSCAAYQFLITRYIGANGQGTKGLANPQVAGITSLNSTFATNLSNLMHAADAAGYRFLITSAYRTCAGQLAVNPTGYGGDCSKAVHTKGVAADFQYPDGGAKDECTGTAHDWLHKNADSYHIGLYDDLHSYVAGECNHVESTTASNGTLGPGAKTTAPTTPLQTITNALGITNANTQQCPPGYTLQGGICVDQSAQQSVQGDSNIYSIPGLGSTPQAGQVLSQDYPCLVTTNPIYYIIIPAGTAIPPGCLNGASSVQNTTPQPCPPGYTLLGGFCTQGPQSMQQIPQQSSQPGAGAGSSAVSGPVPTSAGIQASKNSTGNVANQVSTSVITSPTLVPNLGTSTLALIQALANPPVATQNTATNTPIILSGAAIDISQLQASGIPGVTYAQPTSNITGASGLNGNYGGNNSTVGNNGITTSAGTGYNTSDGTHSGTPITTGSANIIAMTQTPTGADTFGPDTNKSSAGSIPSSSAAPNVLTNTFNSTLVILGVLKNEILGALNFLSNYMHPAPSYVPKQTGGE
jgi:hypothetical protein